MPRPMLRRVGMATMVRMRGSKSARNVPLAFTTMSQGKQSVGPALREHTVY
eukprot:symbB.v1.2.038140.t1/scaffold5841.1/size23192/1